MALFGKKSIVGVSVNPELGLEIAQVDFLSKTVLKYGVTQLTYNNNKREIADMDTFRTAVSDLLIDLNIPKGTEISLNLPAIVFNVTDYPASLDQYQVNGVIEEDLVNHPIFKDNEPLFDAVRLPNSTIQFNKFACTALQKTAMIEIAMYLEELGYPVVAIDTSVNSSLNALIYNDRVDVYNEKPWSLVLIDNAYARILTLQGGTYIEAKEERISIGAVLGDEENYSTVLNAIQPYLAKMPFERLMIVSKTDIISAKALASQIQYNGQIIHEECNAFAAESFLDVSPNVDRSQARNISIDVIGAAIKMDFLPYSTAPINLFNSSLGKIYEDKQPLTIGNTTFTMAKSISLAIVSALLISAVSFGIYIPLQKRHQDMSNKLSSLNTEITSIQKYLDDNNWVSSSKFNEADEVQLGIKHNKGIYSYYSIVGTEIPKKLWLTNLDFGDTISIRGQADNIESVYSFYRNIVDYNPESGLSLNKLALATSNSNITELNDSGEFDADSVLSSLEADFYEFEISNKSGSESKSEVNNLEPLN